MILLPVNDPSWCASIPETYLDMLEHCADKERQLNRFTTMRWLAEVQVRNVPREVPPVKVVEETYVDLKIKKLVIQSFMIGVY